MQIEGKVQTADSSLLKYPLSSSNCERRVLRPAPHSLDITQVSQMACFQVALNDGNGNAIQLKGLQSAFYPQSSSYPQYRSQSAFYIGRL